MAMQWGLRAVAALLVAVGLSVPLTADETLVATNARLGEHPDYTRFVVDLSETVTYRVFTLANPHRVVIDLPEMQWRLPPDTGLTGKGLVRGYRYGQYRKGTSRIVIDLWKPAAVSEHYILPGGDGKPARLVLDLKPQDETEFVKNSGWPDDPLANLIEAEPDLEDPNAAEDPDRKPIIVIDAGHGGVDPGASGTNGVQEKEVVLQAAVALRDLIIDSGRYDVILTRDSDVFLGLRERVAIARRAKADLFISLHADSIDKPSIRGASVYTLSEKASDAEAEALAKSENSSDIVAGADLSEEPGDVRSILINLAQRETKNQSARFAQALMPELKRETVLLEDTHRFAGFVVLKAPDVPSVLVELGFLSNNADEEQLNSEAFRQRVAEALLRSLDAYFAAEAKPIQRAAIPEPRSKPALEGGRGAMSLAGETP